MADMGMNRMAAMDRMAGRDVGAAIKGMIAPKPGAPGGESDLPDRVEALSGNPEFVREVEAVIAKYEGGSPSPAAPPPPEA